MIYGNIFVVDGHQLRGDNHIKHVENVKRKFAKCPISFYDKDGNKIQDPYNDRH